MAESWEDLDALEDDVLLAAMEDDEETNRGHLFDFRLTLGTDRYVVGRVTAPSIQLGLQALRRAVDYVLFTMQHPTFLHAFQ